MALLSSATAIMRLCLLLEKHGGCLCTSSLLQCPSCWRLRVEIWLQSPCSQPQLRDTWPSTYWQLLTSLSYLASFLSKASSKQSSQGMVSSDTSTCLVNSEWRTISGLRVVLTTCLGNLRWHSRSICNCQPFASPTCLPSGSFGLLSGLDKVDGYLGGF